MIEDATPPPDNSTWQARSNAAEGSEHGVSAYAPTEEANIGNMDTGAAGRRQQENAALSQAQGVV
jgi:hypothetical protein